MSDILGLAASAAGGGVFGLIGTGLGRIAGYFEKRQENKHELQRWKFEAERDERQLRAAREAAEAELEKVDLEGSFAGLTASIEAEQAIASSYKWVDAVRALTRPLLTILLCFIALIIYLQADDLNRSAVTETMTFLATAAVLWWFGDRGPGRLPRRNP
mgnify:CR=1 FL=1|tara:strand:- start:4138 stop:4614 length:477 start_codon:yes stop_codon:yes gene_type:complete